MLYCWSVAKKDGVVYLSNMETSSRGMDGEVYDGIMECYCRQIEVIVALSCNII
jgi:hypothetical protein